MISETLIALLKGKRSDNDTFSLYFSYIFSGVLSDHLGRCSKDKAKIQMQKEWTLVVETKRIASFTAIDYANVELDKFEKNMYN